MNLIRELRRRNVVRMAGLYLVGAWLLVQVAATLLPVFAAPGWVMRVLVGLLAAGFIAALVFSWVFERTPGGFKRDDEIPAGESIAPQTARRMDRMIIVVLALALGYFAIDKFVVAPARHASSEPAEAKAREEATTSPNDAAAAGDALANDATAVTANAIGPKSIAVLAFADLSQAQDQAYFSDGVAEEILNALAKVDELRVAGRTSSFYFKGRNETLATIGSTLGVAHVLEGSVRKQGDRLRISAKLLRVADGVELWADSFDGTDADIFALQERIARQVVGELQVALNAGQGSLLVEVGTANPEAYAFHLRATEVFNRRAFERYADAIGDAQRALELDPGFARAHSRLATLYYLSAVTSQPDGVDGLLERASRAAESALALNPALAEPRAVVAVIAQNGRDFVAAREAYSEALRRDANDPTANLWDALARCYLGYIAQCEQRLDRTLAIDPLLPNALGWRSRLYVSAGDLPAAERMVKLAREVGLRWTGVSGAWIALKRGDIDAARAATADTNAVFGAGLPLEAVEAFAGARVGDPKAIAESLRIIDAHLAARPARINALAPLTLVRMGEIDRGLEVFASRATSNDPLFLGELMGTRLYSDAWASPEFPEFLRKTNIAAYWDAFGAPEHCRRLTNGDYRCE